VASESDPGADSLKIHFWFTTWGSRRLKLSIDTSQHRRMSNKLLPILDTSGCGSPLVREPLAESDAASLAQVFKALADPVRLRLFSLIASYEGGEACVCDLTPAFDVTQPTISHHLKVLRDAGLIESERRGTWIYYWVRPEALARLSDLLAPAGASA
jgi:ArsR family transcriptional regulator